MPTVQNNEETLTFKVAMGLIGLSGVLLPMQMVPGWAMFDMGWPPWMYYAVMAACWGVGWGLVGWHYRVPAVIAGAVGGVGCLAAITTLLANTTWTHGLIIMVVGAIGAAPGGLVYWVLSRIQDLFIPPPPGEVLPPLPDMPQEPEGERPTGIRG